MAVRGENIGTAFVRLLIDGKGMPRQVREELKRVDKEFEKAGDREGDALADHVRKSFVRNKVKKADVDKFLGEMVARSNEVANFVGAKSGDSFFNNFRRSVRKHIGDDRLGEEFVRKFEEDFARAGGDASFTKLFDREGNIRSTSKAVAEFAKRVEQARIELAKQDVLLDRQGSDLRKRFVLLREETARLSAGATRDFENLSFSIERTSIEAKDLRANFEDLSRGMDDKQIREFNSELAAIEHRLRVSSPTLIHYRRRTDLLSEGLGRAFGRRSRSELLNFVGVLSERVTRAFFKVGQFAIRGVVAVGSFVKTFTEGMQGAAEGASRLTKIGAGLSAVGGRLGAALAPLLSVFSNPLTAVAGLAVIAAAVVALSTAMAFLSSTILGVVGALGALLITAGAGLVSALGGVVAALLPLGVGIGLVVAGVKSLDESAKKALTNSLQPLTDQFKELGRLAATNIFGGLDEQVKGLAAAFDTPIVKEFVDETSKAVREVIDSFALIPESEGFKTFVLTMTEEMPTQIVLLGQIFENFGAGVGNIFTTLAPQLTDFLNRINLAGQAFKAFTEEPLHQAQFIEFFALAGRAASALGGLILKIGELIVKLFVNGAGQAGIKIFDSMKGKVQELIDFIEANPEKVEKFFEDARIIAEKLGNIVLKIGEGIANFASEDNRQLTIRLLTVIEGLAGAFERISRVLSKIPGLLGKLSLDAFPGLRALVNALKLVAKFGGEDFEGGSFSPEHPTQGAKGATFGSGEWGIVGEEGPELVRFPSAARVFSNPDSKALLAGASSQSVTINNFFTGPVIGSEAARVNDWNLRFSTRYSTTEGAL